MHFEDINVKLGSILQCSVLGYPHPHGWQMDAGNLAWLHVMYMCTYPSTVDAVNRV